MNAGCFDEPLPLMFSCFRAKFLCFCDDAFEFFLSTVDSWIEPPLLIAPVSPPPPQETTEDQITSAGA